jgi:cytochrome c oxidase cbb3-type subunit 3
VSRDKDQLLGHAEDNDGIEEYDNALPDWWLGLFVLTVIWGIGYAVDYHFVSERSQLASYEAEMAAAAVRWPVTESALVFDEATVAAGAKIFAANCVACHNADLTGGIGPNLIDGEWIHGGEPEDIRGVVTEGVPAKGMVGWGPILGPERIAQVTAFVVTEGKVHAASGRAAQAAAAPAAAVEITGESVYTANCMPCHGANLEGLVGPSLVDAEWIHGGSLEEIEQVITNGVPEKGMVSWGPILGPEKIQRVAAFVHGRSNGE